MAFVGILEAAGYIASGRKKQRIMNIHAQFIQPRIPSQGRAPPYLLWFFPLQLPESRNPALTCPEPDLRAGSRPLQVGN